MRDLKTILKDMITKPPVLFPLVALFHIVLFVVAIVTLIQQPGSATELSALWLLGYMAFWLACTDLRKWGAIGYVLVTAADIVTYYSTNNYHDRNMHTSNLFLIDIAFSFFIILYYRKFR